MKVALTIAGSDPSGGAGIQADLKTFHQHGTYGTAVITLITVQNTVEIRRVEILHQDLVGEQIQSVLDDIPPDAIKTGALGSARNIRAVAASLKKSTVPLVVDPVMVSTHGASLAEEDSLDAYINDLFPLAALITPNIPEAISLGRRAGIDHEDGESIESLRKLANGIRSLGVRAVLIKGGHRTAEPTDLLVGADYEIPFPGERIETSSTHGTGCTLSAAITAQLALGRELRDAIERSKKFVADAIRTAPNLGKGFGPVNHFT